MTMQWALNQSRHKAIQASPHEIIYGVCLQGPADMASLADTCHGASCLQANDAEDVKDNQLRKERKGKNLIN